VSARVALPPGEYTGAELGRALAFALMTARYAGLPRAPVEGDTDSDSSDGGGAPPSGASDAASSRAGSAWGGEERAGGGGDPAALPFEWQCEVAPSGLLRLSLRGGTFFRFVVAFDHGQTCDHGQTDAAEEAGGGSPRAERAPSGALSRRPSSLGRQPSGGGRRRGAAGPPRFPLAELLGFATDGEGRAESDRPVREGGAWATALAAAAPWGGSAEREAAAPEAGVCRAPEAQGSSAAELELAEMLLARPQAAEAAVLVRDTSFAHSKVFMGMLQAGVVPRSCGAALGVRPAPAPPDGRGEAAGAEANGSSGAIDFAFLEEEWGAAGAGGAGRGAAVARLLSDGFAATGGAPPPSPSPRNKWTRRVPHPVLIGHTASLTPY